MKYYSEEATVPHLENSFERKLMLFVQNATKHYYVATKIMKR